MKVFVSYVIKTEINSNNFGNDIFELDFINKKEDFIGNIGKIQYFIEMKMIEAFKTDSRVFEPEFINVIILNFQILGE
jgi:hypothetical protein